MIINKKNKNKGYKYNRALWCGNLYNHIDNKNNIKKMRLDMYNGIRDKIDSGRFTESEFINKIREYKVIVDLIGVGDPNKRTIEILTTGSLMLSMCGDLNWGFDNNENFHPDTYFKTPEEFTKKLEKLLNDEEHYKKCLEHQEYIVNKYFNKRWLREYIEKKLEYL